MITDFPNCEGLMDRQRYKKAFDTSAKFLEVDSSFATYISSTIQHSAPTTSYTEQFSIPLCIIVLYLYIMQEIRNNIIVINVHTTYICVSI